MNNFITLQGRFTSSEVGVFDIPLPPGPLTFVGLYLTGGTSGSPTGRTISLSVVDANDDAVVTPLASTTWAVGLNRILPTEAKKADGSVIVPEGGPYLLRVSHGVTGGSSPTASMEFVVEFAH